MRAYRLTACDATNLELAKRRGLPLASDDRDLRSAAAAAGVSVLSPGVPLSSATS
jgi:predicted nucleic acid-binding protein